MSEMVIRNLHVSIEGNEILKGVNLTIPQGEVHAIMGPNGTGKSTLAYTIMGHPSYQVTDGEVIFKGQNILKLAPDADPGWEFFWHSNIQCPYRAYRWLIFCAQP